MNLSVSFRCITLGSLLGLAGCVSIPANLDGEYSEAFQPSQATERSIGARIRWGGVVIETRPEQTQTCIEILAQPLDSSARPVRSDQNLGRFIACREQFFDPEIFVKGRELTVIGQLQGFDSGTVGEFEYRFPVLQADAVHLWPERVTLHSSDPYLLYPYHYGYWPYYHGYGLYPWGYPRYGYRSGFRVHGSGVIHSVEPGTTRKLN